MGCAHAEHNGRNSRHDESQTTRHAANDIGSITLVLPILISVYEAGCPKKKGGNPARDPDRVKRHTVYRTHHPLF